MLNGYLPRACSRLRPVATDDFIIVGERFCGGCNEITIDRAVLSNIHLTYRHAIYFHQTHRNHGIQGLSLNAVIHQRFRETFTLKRLNIQSKNIRGVLRHAALPIGQQVCAQHTNN